MKRLPSDLVLPEDLCRELGLPPSSAAYDALESGPIDETTPAPARLVRRVERRRRRAARVAMMTSLAELRRQLGDLLRPVREAMNGLQFVRDEGALQVMLK